MLAPESGQVSPDGADMEPTKQEGAQVNGDPEPAGKPYASASRRVVLYVVGGAGSEPNPAVRAFPLVNQQAESGKAHLARVIQLIDAAKAAGGTHLLVPREQADWLGDHPLVAEYFAQRYEMVGASDETGIVFALYP